MPVDFTHPDLAHVAAAIAIVLNVIVYWMKTMIPLRILAIAVNVLFIIYSALTGIYPTLILNCILLPLNSLRLYQMLILIRRIRLATGTDFDMTWLKPFMSHKNVAAGAALFTKGDKADAMFIVVGGKFHLAESGIAIPPGTIVGELGMLAPQGQRTQTLICDEAGEVLAIKYNDFKQLYLQNPQFGFYFLQLTARRLFENIGNLENAIAARDVRLPEQSRPVTAS